MAPQIITLNDLPGTSTRTIQAAIFSDAAEALTLLKRYRAISASGDHGAITVWKDDQGFFRCERHVNRFTRSEGRYSKVDYVKTWLDCELPKLHSITRTSIVTLEDPMRKLERSLAYEMAVLAMEGLAIETEGPFTESFQVGVREHLTEDDSAVLDEAITYLDSRGLLQRAVNHPNIIAILDESEEQAGA